MFYPVVRVGFEETSLTVSESQESVEICINITSPGIEENLTVYITSDNEGMLYSVILFVKNCSYRIFSKLTSVSHFIQFKQFVRFSVLQPILRLHI